MHPTLAPDYGIGDYRSSDPVDGGPDVDALEMELLTRTVRLTRELPKGVRAPSTVQLAKDITRTGRPTIARWLRLALGGIQSGQSAGLYGELVADVLGACAATVLPVSDASLAETLAECAGDPKQELANRPGATPAQLLDAARAMEEQARASTAAARAYRRAYRESLRGDAGQGWSAWESQA